MEKSVIARTIKELIPFQLPARMAARRRLDRLEPHGISVVIVTWNGLEFLRVNLDAVRTYSPPSVRIIVVDNASDDGTRKYLEERDDVDVLRMPFNIGHDLALDFGFLRARTEFAVALDMDAFPFRPTWLDVLLKPLDDGYHVSGGRYVDYAHPSFLGMRVRRFVEQRHTFLAHMRGARGGTEWDVGQNISMREGPAATHLIEPTSIRGPGPLGTVFGDVVYHNFFSVRFLRYPEKEWLESYVRREDSSGAWEEATQRYLGR